jgi:hypothetical protein
MNSVFILEYHRPFNLNTIRDKSSTKNPTNLTGTLAYKALVEMPVLFKFE